MQSLRRQLRLLRGAEPGTRFVGVFERTRVHNFAVRVALIVIGCACMLGAALTFWLPGPNWVLVLVGLGIICGQSYVVAHSLDRVEVAVRRWHHEQWEPYPHKAALMTALISVGLTLAAVACWFSWQREWIPHRWLQWLPLID